MSRPSFSPNQDLSLGVKIKLSFLFHKVTVFGPKLPFFVGPKLPFIWDRVTVFRKKLPLFWHKVTVMKVTVWG